MLLRAGRPTPRARTVVEVRPHPDLSSTHKRKQTHADAVTRDRMRTLAPPISRPRRPPARRSRNFLTLFLKESSAAMIRFFFIQL